MICFIEECHSDTLLYYPIIKKLEERKTDYIVYDVRGKSTIDTIHFFSQNPTIKSVVKSV
jgi:MinD-like ATPase involved in chromosome partitioning or flagellar assembly